MTDTRGDDRGRGAEAGGGDPQGWLRTVLDLLPVPALLIETGSARVLFANRAAGGIPLDAGRDDVGAEDGDGSPIPPERWPHRRAASGEALDRMPVAWTRPDGRASYLASSGAVPAMRGRPAMALLTFVEVTAIEAAEEELRRAIEARDEFFSFATHELKDPLSSLLLSRRGVLRRRPKSGDRPGATSSWRGWRSADARGSGSPG